MSTFGMLTAVRAFSSSFVLEFVQRNEEAGGREEGEKDLGSTFSQVGITSFDIIP